jgi:putative modified peptide
MSSFKLPVPVINRLLDCLSNDDAFRDQFVADPRVALAAIGFEPAADRSIRNGIWECLPVAQLATKEVIRASYLQLQRQFTMQVDPQHPFALEAIHMKHHKAA